MYANRRNLRAVKEIGVKEHDGDVRFFTGSGNTAVSRMRNASGHNYWRTSFIMDVAMGQIPRSTERINNNNNISGVTKPAFQLRTSCSSIEHYDQKLASITQRTVKLLCVTKFTHSLVDTKLIVYRVTYF